MVQGDHCHSHHAKNLLQIQDFPSIGLANKEGLEGPVVAEIPVERDESN